MLVGIPLSSYDSLKVIPDERCPHPRYTTPDKTNAMFSVGFKDTISIYNDSRKHKFLGREVKQLPDVIKSTLFSTHYHNSIASETNINTNNVLQILNSHMFPKLDAIECSVCSYDKGILNYHQKSLRYSRKLYLFILIILYYIYIYCKIFLLVRVI